MRAATIIAATFAAGALALPQAGWWPMFPGMGFQACLNDTGAAYLIEKYTYLLEQPTGEDFVSTVNEICSDKFHVISDSIQTLQQQSFDQDAYPSKQYFAASGAHTPPMPNVETLDVYHTCDKISWRWSGSGLGPLRVRGMITMEVDAAALQIDTVYAEFNTAAWQIDLGNPECKSNK